MTTAEIQNLILDQTGIKTSVKKLSGSMKQHLCFSPMFQNGSYPEYPTEWRREFVKQFKVLPGLGNYQNSTQIHILKINIEEGEPMKFKKENKPKTIHEMNVREWGSQNSQLRLDKAAARHAKAVRQGKDTVRYY